MAESVRLGVLPIEPVRDAVHVAVFPAFCEVSVMPGDRVEITPDRDGQLVKVKWVPSGGDAVADPFLDSPMPPGTAFYALLRPGSVTGLRHLYFHPKLRAVPPRVG